jgi:hypothetical protein
MKNKSVSTTNVERRWFLLLAIMLASSLAISCVKLRQKSSSETAPTQTIGSDNRNFPAHSVQVIIPSGTRHFLPAFFKMD